MTKTKRMQSPYYEGAPAIVRDKVAFIAGPFKSTPCPFDVLFVEQCAGEIVGLDFDEQGVQGCHFFLKPHEAASYRLRNRRKKIRWADLPKGTQTAIIAYLERE